MNAQARTKRSLVTVSLECGHQVTAKNPPMGGHTRYICTAGTGCGYRVKWTQYHSFASGLTYVNPERILKKENDT